MGRTPVFTIPDPSKTIAQNSNRAPVLESIKDERKSKHNRYSYEEINCVEWMIRNKYNSLLKLKVKRGEYLFFFKEVGNPSALESIFKHNELNNDLEFLIQLFQNYKDYFLPSSYECIEQSIKCDCLPVFKLFFETDHLKDYRDSLFKNDKIGTDDHHHDHQLFYKLFKLSINSNSFSISKFINDRYKITKENSFSINDFWKEILVEYREHTSDIIETNTILSINSRVDFILNQLKLSEPIKKIPNLLNSFYPIKIETISLKDLLHSNYTILKIKNVFDIKEIEQQSTIEIVKNFSLLTLNELDQMIFKENDLKTSIKLFNSNEYQGNIGKLFLNLIPFTTKIKEEFSFFSSLSIRPNFYNDNLLFYFKKYQSKFSQFSTGQSMTSLQIDDVLIWQDSMVFPFENFKYDKSLQFEFISVIAKEILNNPLNPKNFTKDKLLNQLIGFDCLDLIKFLFDQLNSINIPLISLCKSKSIEVFDFLYNRLSLPSISLEYLLVYCAKDNLLILDHYKKSYPNQYHQSLKGDIVWSTITISIMAFTFLYANIDDFIEHYDSFDIWSIKQLIDSNRSSFLYRSFDCYKFFVESTPSNKSYRCYYDSQNIGSDYFEILHWLMKTKKSDIESGRCSFSLDTYFSNEIPLLYHYYHGSLESRLSTVNHTFLFSQTNSKIFNLIVEIGKRGDIESFKMVINKINSLSLEENIDESILLVFRSTLTKILIKTASQYDRFQIISFCSKIFSINQLSKETIIKECQRNGSIKLATILKYSLNYTFNYENIENINYRNFSSSKQIFSNYSNHSKKNSFNENGNNYKLMTAIGVSATIGLGFFSILNLEEEEKKKIIIEKNKIDRIPDEAKKELVLIFSERFVTHPSDLEAHGKDFSYHERASPDAVIYPHNLEEVKKLVDIVRKYKIPLIACGAMTSLEGHTLSNYGGITVDFRNMSRILQVYKDDFYVTVQPGISYGDLNEELKKIGFFFPVDPGPGATIGGMIGTSASGTHCVHYGTMKDNVLSMKVVLPNGDIVTTRSKAKKSSAGYDLNHLFIGSEGTLGIIVEASLKIQPIPTCSQVSLVTFDNITSACDAVIKTMQSGVQIGRVELLDDVMMNAVNLASNTNYSEKPTLIFEFSGPSQGMVQEQISKVSEITKQCNSLDFKFSSTAEEKENLWMARKVALWSSKILRPSSEVWITDACVPISKLSQIIEESKIDISKTSLQAPLVAHAGDGNFHLFILFDPNNPKEFEEAKFINDNLVNRAIEYKGTCTGEHGVSFGKIKYLDKELGTEAVDLMATIKRSIDPTNIMNPGKVISVEKFNEKKK
ncbi:hypothetical protein RB653_009690 [Dictyostelium firmibasis]|uniref:D-lactate dehydrogenase (cytochrome) n=1 Tax=Dictyostelium firmibasis TaxID=79012 RepID=A0AAN7YUV2_9MYCE